MDRQQFDGCDTELDEMVDDCRMGQSSIGAAHGEWHVRMEIRQALYMGFVDDSGTPAMARRAVIAPWVSGIVDHAFGHHWRTVPPVEDKIAAMRAQTVAKQCIVPDDAAVEPTSVRIDQQLIGIKTMPFIWRVRAMHAVAVKLAGLYALKIAVPDLVGSLRQAEALRLMPAVVLEQAEIHGARMGRKQGEINAAAVPGCAE